MQGQLWVQLIGKARFIGAWATAVVFAAVPSEAPAVEVRSDDAWRATVYAARVSGKETWQHVLKDPFSANYVDSYLVAGALSREYARFRAGALSLEAEGQLAYNFGRQDHWEFNAVPIVARWNRFPWSDRVASSAAFGLGVSYATELPETEVELEGTSHQSLVYWVLELSAGRVQSPWQMVFRLHHRSVAWGLMGESGGVNALGFGIKYRFACCAAPAKLKLSDERITRPPRGR